VVLAALDVPVVLAALDVPVVLVAWAVSVVQVVPAAPSGNTIRPIEVAPLMVIALLQTNSAARRVVIH